jgi:hypothetical protein
MNASSPPALMIGEESAGLMPQVRIAIRSVQPDREHAVLEVVGAPGFECVGELWQRVEGLLVAGVRYLLVDLADAVPGDAVVSVLAETAGRLEARQGWLRVNRQEASLPVGLPEATLGELFAIYRSFVRAAGADGAVRTLERERPRASTMIRPGGAS